MIALYCPDLPPAKGGVADHTIALARGMAALGGDPLVLALRGDPDRAAPVPCRVDVSLRDLPAAVADAGARSVILQYVPFLYARRGLSPALLTCTRRLVAAGVSLGLIVHEPYVPFTRLPWLVTGWPMRWQLRWMVRRARRVFTAVPRWAETMRRWARDPTTVEVAPIGATLPVSSLDRASARRELGLSDGTVAIGVFSPAASGFLAEWIGRAASRLAGHPSVTWVLFGHGSEVFLPGLESRQAVIRLGSMNGDAEVPGRIMRALDLALAPYADGLTFRRTSPMLALAHGVPTVSSTGHLFDPAAGALAGCEDSPEAFAARVEHLASDGEARAALARRAAHFQETGSLEILAARIVSEFGHP